MEAAPSQIRAAPPSHGEDISIEKWHRLQKQVKEFRKLQPTLRNMYFDRSQTFYILSNKFLEQWKMHAGFHLPQSPFPQLHTSSAPDPFNHDLLEPENPSEFVVSSQPSSPYRHMLKRELTENVHYNIVNEKIMQIFSGSYGGTLLPRKFVTLSSGSCSLESVFMRVRFMVVSPMIADRVYSKKIKSLPVMTGTISKYADLNQWRKQISLYWIQKYVQYGLKQNLQSNANLKNFRVWQFESMTEGQFNSLLRNNDFVSGKIVTRMPRCRQITHCTKFGDLNLSEKYFVIIEFPENGKMLFEFDNLSSSSEAKCDFCGHSTGAKPVQCQCKKVFYCSSECLKSDVIYHQSKCPTFREKDCQFNFSKNSLMGKVGLSNLGNTCYMNTAIQCLSNTTILTQFFSNTVIKNHINKENPLGSKGAVANAYAYTLKNLWCGTNPSFSPSLLKTVIGETNSIFLGYQQHDSQEFLLTMLDMLHEDFNRVKVKPYYQTHALKGADEEVAKKSWEYFISRNQSIITDLFAGQYKSKVKCPVCKTESTTFQPFYNLTLPIVCKETVVFYFLGYARESIYYKVQIQMEDPTVEKLTKTFAKMLGSNYDPKRLKFFMLDTNIVDLSQVPFTKIQQYTRKQSLYCIELTEEQASLYTTEVDDINKLNVYFLKTKQSQASRAPISRPFWFRFSKMTIRDIEKHIWKWIFTATISKKQTEDISFGKYFINPVNAPFRFYLKIKQTTGKMQYYKSKQQLSSKDQLKNIQANYPQDSKFQLECNVDCLTMPVCDDKKFSTFTDFKYLLAEEDDASINLKACFDKLRKTQVLNDGNQWMCEICKVHRNAQKTMSLYKTSKYLIIHLKRFKQKNNYFKVKIQKLVEFPQILDLSDHLVNYKTPMDDFQTLRQLNPTIDRNKARYNLHAVINHIGALGGGHYFAFAKNDSQWYEFNDSSVTPIATDKVCTQNAYVLFYTRQ